MTALAPIPHINDSTKTKSKGKNIFTFNPVEYQEEFAKNGFVLIRNGINTDFLAVAIEQAEKRKIDQKELNNCFKVKKWAKIHRRYNSKNLLSRFCAN